MIQNEFTIEVYETHARIALRNVDIKLTFNFRIMKIKYSIISVLNRKTETNLINVKVNLKVYTV